MFLWYYSCKKAQKVTQQSLVLVSQEIHLNTVGFLGTALVHCIMGTHSLNPITSKWDRNSIRLTKKSDHASMHIVLG